MSMDESSTLPSIGIDLGTTNSCVAVWQDEWVKIIPNEQGNTTTPSCVAFTDTRYYVGESAEQQATTNPSNTILDVKRLIRKQFNSAKVQNDIKLLPLEVVAGPDDTPMISVQHQGKMQQCSASEISSMILHKLYKIAKDFLDCPIKNAVISVPACFNDSQRLAIVKASNNVGLNVMRIINEPTAAAIAYGFNNINDCDGEKNVLIFDLGGGTLDVSILNIEREKYEVKATVGDSHLGGADFDNQLIRHCIEELKREHSGKDLNLNSRALGKLRYACKEAKIILSSTPEADIDIDSLLPGIHFQACITRAKFEELNKDLFERCIDMVDKCLVDAKMYRSSIHDIILIGGSTRIPKVQQMLREYFDGKELSMRINSDEAVACGAAIQAAILSNMSDKVPNFIVHDITTHSLGIDIAKQVSMIPRNSAIPITKKMILTAGQIEFPIKVYEGEMTRIQDNHLLVEFPIQPVDPYSIIVGIDVCFNINENGIFTISVEDKREINRTQITCDSMSTTSGEQVEMMAEHTKKLKLEEGKYKQKPEAKNSPMTLGGHLGMTIKKEVSKLATVGNKKVKHAIVKTRQRREKNRRAVVREEFAGGQYRGDVNCLEKEPAQAGAVNLRRSSTPATRMMDNSTMMTKKKNFDSMFTTSACKLI